MKAIELLNNVLKILGYTDSDGNAEITSRIRNCAVVTVNLVYADLWRMFNDTPLEPIKSLNDKIELPQNVLNECFLYGLAMHIARSENDGDQQQLYTMLYNAKRAAFPRFDKVKNVIPKVGDC